MAFRLKYPLHSGVAKCWNWSQQNHYFTCVWDQNSHRSTHTHTSFCDHSEKITLLCMAGVTSIQENSIEKHYTEEEGIYVENNAEPSLKAQTGQKCRSKPTASFQLEKTRLRFFWKTLCGNTPWLQPHLGSIHHWKQLQKISETLVSSRFPTTWKRSKNKSNTTVQWQRNTREREMSHNIYHN